DTLGHIAAGCAEGKGDRQGLRSGALALPHLASLGLGAAAHASTGRWPAGLGEARQGAAWGFAVGGSKGKGTPSAPWHIPGCPVPLEWGYFPQPVPCFPADLVARIVAEAGLPGVLGERHASGTQIIAELGSESAASGRPILYTSADSVIQIAAHEVHFGLDRL